MPRIPTRSLSTVYYLYKNQEDAETGINKVGTGFVVSIPSVIPGSAFRYFVTNWHVALQGAPVIRVDKVDGTPDIFELDPTQWDFLPKYDIAVSPVRISGETHNIIVIGREAFLTKEWKEREKIGPGDDVFMIGLFVDHHDLNRNVPSVRFGNISMDPALLEQPNEQFAESYCLDMHSRSGYSGSPVYVYRTPGYDLEEKLGRGKDRKFLLSGTNHLSFLGIHYGQFPEMWEVTNKGKLKNQRNSEGSEPLLTEGRFIKGLSGMTCVLPAWSILEVLDMPKLKKKREAENAKLAEMAGDRGGLGNLNKGDK